MDARDSLERLGGKGLSMTLNHGRNDHIDVLTEVEFPSSVGGLYSQVTSHLGFREEQEGNTMALAAFGTSPRGMLLASAGIDIVLGVLFMVNPGGSAKGITVVLGIVALVWGIALVVIGLAWRRQPTREPAAA